MHKFTQTMPTAMSSYYCLITVTMSSSYCPYKFNCKQFKPWRQGLRFQGQGSVNYCYQL